MATIAWARCNFGPHGGSVVFTDQRVYEARHYKNRLWTVRDDFGLTRAIMFDGPCPHLKDANDQSSGWWTREERYR